MKRFLFGIVLSALSMTLFSQTQDEQVEQVEKNNCITIGVLQGGGCLIGADFEILLSRQFGFQIGGGFVGFGGGFNFHFKPTVRSSFLSLQYWHQGVGESFAQNAIGGTYVFRGKKWLTFQIGIGFPLEKGRAMPEDYEQPPAMLLYSIGAYIPL